MTGFLNGVSVSPLIEEYRDTSFELSVTRSHDGGVASYEYHASLQPTGAGKHGGGARDYAFKLGCISSGDC